jgi:putative transposase
LNFGSRLELQYMFEDFASLSENEYYHIFNRSVGDEKLFVTHENYRYFMEKLNHYLSPISDLFCYTFLPRHFNLFIRIKNASLLCEHMERLSYRDGCASSNIPQFLMEQFSNCFNAYAKAFNKQRNRKGRLFMEPYRRRRIRDPAEFIDLVCSIHADPVYKGLCTGINKWPHSSYHLIGKMGERWLCSEEVINWFGSMEEFRKAHALPAKKPGW